MLGSKSVLVIGTGTIGEPLIGLLCNFKAQLGIDEVMFHKRTPLMTDRSKVQNLLRRGARLVTDKDRVAGFEKIGLKVETITEDAMEASRGPPWTTAACPGTIAGSISSAECAAPSGSAPARPCGSSIRRRC